ncbi:MAG: TRAP transporter large permease subunit, partial [Saccharospirillum sp.]
MEVTLLGEILALVMFFAVIGALMLGFPVAFSLAGTSLIFATIAHFLGALDLSNLSSVAPRYMGIMLNEVLVAVPLFIFMGMMLERSGIAEKL